MLGLEKEGQLSDHVMNDITSTYNILVMKVMP
jgi:hypothetical protein